MHNKRATKLLDGLEKLLKLHNRVFNDPKTIEEAEAIRNWNIAWPEEYRVMRSILMQQQMTEEDQGDMPDA